MVFEAGPKVLDVIALTVLAALVAAGVIFTELA